LAIKLNYLNSLRSYLRLDSTTEDDVVRELRTHIEDKSEEFMESGLSADEATRAATQSLGSPTLVAKQMYEVYSQGSWKQALFAALPHILVALFFAMHWWHITACLSPILVVVIGVAIYGWTHGKPAWLFPWLGYCLTPVIVIGTLLINLSSGWVWVAAITYIPLALFVLLPVTRKTIERDWLFASLMLLPIPVILGWRLALGIEDMQQWLARIYDAAQLIALSFAVLALTVTTFIRVRQRWAKAGALLTHEIILLVVVASADKNAIGLYTWIFLILLFLFLVISPALLDPVVRCSSSKMLLHTAHKTSR
jgi:hypothetical protein